MTHHFKTINPDLLKSLNILKIFTYKTYGAHPKIMLNVYKSIVKSKYIPALITTNENIKTINNKLQNVTNNCLRTALGLTKSTPIPATLAESGEKPTPNNISSAFRLY